MPGVANGDTITESAGRGMKNMYSVVVLTTIQINVLKDGMTPASYVPRVMVSILTQNTVKI